MSRRLLAEGLCLTGIICTLMGVIAVDPRLLVSVLGVGFLATGVRIHRGTSR